MGNAELLKSEIQELRRDFESQFENFVETATNYMNDMKKDLNAKTLENEALREDFSYNLN